MPPVEPLDHNARSVCLDAHLIELLRGREVRGSRIALEHANVDVDVSDLEAGCDGQGSICPVDDPPVFRGEA
ncbi:hypothetical protein ACFPRL_34200 [Pseudoclavibacter helvolus]